MSEFTVAGQRYSFSKLDAFAQFHVARRLAPVFSRIKAAAELGKTKADDAMEAAVLALSSMPEQDCNYVLHACLMSCKRQQGGVWANLTAGSTFPPRMMFDDIGLAEMMQIAWHVLQGNFESFFSGLLATPSGKAGEAGA
jgi:hypothetical protein